MKGTALLINIAESKSVFKIRKKKLIQKDIQKVHPKGLPKVIPVTFLKNLGKFRM
jgi:hypothetical protein